MVAMCRMRTHFGCTLFLLLFFLLFAFLLTNAQQCINCDLNGEVERMCVPYRTRRTNPCGHKAPRICSVLMQAEYYKFRCSWCLSSFKFNSLCNAMVYKRLPFAHEYGYLGKYIYLLMCHLWLLLLLLSMLLLCVTAAVFVITNMMHECNEILRTCTY